MTVLVIAARGLVGGEVARLLASRGVSVRALVRDPSLASPLTALGIEVVGGDLRKPESLAPAVAGVERVFLASPLDPHQVELQRNAVEAARSAGVRHVVKLSGLATSLDSGVASGQWHARIEEAIEASGMRWTHLRPLFFFQNLLRAAPLVKSSGVVPNTIGAAAVAAVDARDVAACAAAALGTDEHFGCAYDITGSDALTYGDLVDRLSQLLGRTIRTVELTPSAARERMVDAGMPSWHADVLTDFAIYFARGDGARVTDAVRRLTGRDPRSVGEFLDEHAAAFGAAG